MAFESKDQDYYITTFSGITSDATETEIKKHKSSLRWHPDKNPNNQKKPEKCSRQSVEAYEVLSDPVKRRAYDNPDLRFQGFGWRTRIPVP